MNSNRTRLGTIATLCLAIGATQGSAVGLDRSGQSITPLFETGNYAEFSFGFTEPSVSGRAFAGFGGAPTGNVAGGFSIIGAAIKFDVNDRLSFAVIGDQPYGADTLYPGSNASTILGGTGATVNSTGIAALARFKINENFSVHGGLRYQEVGARVTLGGLAFNSPASPLGPPSGVNGYASSFGTDGDVGYVIGAAYEIPKIALRFALTYNSGTSHNLDTIETIRGLQISAPGAVTRVRTPESVNLDFQTGVAKDTLLFGSLRYASYSDTDVSPAGFVGLTGNSLTDLEDGFDFEIGVGRRFSDKWSGSVSAGFSTEGADNLVSPLSPTNGSQFIALGAKYDVNDRVAISGGVRYTNIGNAISAPGGTGVANFSGNSAVSAGLRVAFQF